MPKNKILVDYTSREFNSIKQDLEDHARLYYPDSYKDFSENSFGSYVLDTVAYVGDMLSFYLDYQVNESFLETAVEYDNITRLTKNIRYKTPGRPAAFGLATFYVGIPANTSGLGPDRNLLPILKAGAEMSTDDGTSFVLLEDVDFSNESEVRKRIDYLERLKSKLGNDIKFTEKSKVEKAIAALKRGLDN